VSCDVQNESDIFILLVYLHAQCHRGRPTFSMEASDSTGLVQVAEKQTRRHERDHTSKDIRAVVGGQRFEADTQGFRSLIVSHSP
jgi:hypothetical protein